MAGIFARPRHPSSASGLSPLPADREEHLALREIDLRHTAPDKQKLTEEDLLAADVIVALKDDEHRPMMRTQFPSWVDRVTFWDVGDQPEVRPEYGLPSIEKQVMALIEELGGADFAALTWGRAA